MKKAILAAVAVIAGLSAQAQTKDLQFDLAEFTGIEVSGAFDVTLVNSPVNNVTLTVDEAISMYAKAYIKGKTLYISLDEKSIPKEVKALYKGKNTPKPVLKAVVRTEALNSISIADEVVFSATEPIATDKLIVTATGSSKVTSLNVSAGSVKVSSDKKAMVNLTLNVDEVTATPLAQSNVKLSGTMHKATLSAASSSTIAASIETDVVVIDAAGSSTTTVSGSAEDLEVKGAGSSTIDALNLTVPDAKVVLSGSSTLTESASNELSIDLQGGSTLNMNGDPKVNIVSIKRSTVLRYNKQ